MQGIMSFRFMMLGFCASTAVATAGTVFSDNTFNVANYSTGFLYVQDGSATATYTQCASCGNPGQALEITFNEPTGGTSGITDLFIGIINNTFSYNPGTQGAITSISATADKNFTLNQAAFYANTFRPLIEQDGNFYAAAIPVLI
jgi:hypothetical protein